MQIFRPFSIFFRMSVVVGLFGLSVIGCEGAREGTTAIPTTNVTCTTDACESAGDPSTADFIIYFTTSSCESPFFDQSSLVTGNGTVNCNSLGCTGSVSQWSRQGEPVTVMDEGFYSVCGFIDLVQAGVPDEAYTAPGNPRFAMEGVNVSSSVGSFSLTSWSDNSP